MRLLLITTLLLSSFALGHEKEAVFTIINSKASTLTKQTVTLNAYTFNMTSNWALAYGELKPTSARSIDWSQLKQCDSLEDKNFWAVLKKNNAQWEFVQLYICAPEPPYWYLEEDIGLIWPCELYRGLKAEPDTTLYEKCIKNR